MVEIFFKGDLIATLDQDEHRFLIDYKDLNLQKSISLSLPNTKRFYTYEHRFPPFLETFLPEGYLYEVFKNLLTKEFGYINDYLIFSKLAPNIEGRISFGSEFERYDFSFLDIDNIIENDSADTFKKLFDMFLGKNSISGVQPKTVALLQGKESLRTKEYIVKTWGEAFPHLAENEYFCLKACEKAGLKIPDITLSKNRRFLIVENFIFQGGKALGFEEILSLQDKNRSKKYSGSYEQVAKVIYQFCTNKKESLVEYYTMVVMNYLLKNGDAHLKNFGLLFDEDFSHIWMSPTYDVVNTTSYIFTDKPALTMQGKKVWHSRDNLIRFGIKNCLLNKREAENIYDKCIEAVRETIVDIKEYLLDNPQFQTVANRMIDSFALSIIQQDTTLKELPLELTRTWR